MTQSIEAVEEKFEREIEKTNDILNKVLAMVQSHETYVSDGRNWRITVIGLAFTMIIQVCGGLYLAGQLTERVENNARISAKNELRLDRQDEKFERLFREEGAAYRNNTSK